MNNAIQDIQSERERQKALAHGGNTDAFDKENTQADWITFITRYASGASPRLGRKDLGFREAMVKVGALAVAAIEAFDAGNAQN